jgi:Uma2 family endonuclease
VSAPLVRPYVTYEALCRMAAPESRWELFDGEAYMSPSPNLRHQLLCQRLFLAFQGAIRDADLVLFAPMDVVLSPGTVHQPDLILVLNKNRGILKDVVRGAPDLVVEVLSPSHAERDRVMKMETYSRHGVGEYWIVDDEARQVEIYRLDPEAGAYRLAATCSRSDSATTPLRPALRVDLSDLFQQPF